MTPLITRNPGNPRDGRCRHASVPSASMGQLGFACQQDRRVAEYGSPLGNQFHAGFRIEVRTP